MPPEPRKWMQCQHTNPIPCTLHTHLLTYITATSVLSHLSTSHTLVIVCRWAAVKCFWGTGRLTSSTTAVTSFIKRSSPVRKVKFNIINQLPFTVCLSYFTNTSDFFCFVLPLPLSGAWLAGETAPSSQAVIAAERGVQCPAFPAGGRRHGAADLRPVGHPKCIRYRPRERPPAMSQQQPPQHPRQQPTAWWEAWASGQGGGSACQEVN